MKIKNDMVVGEIKTPNGVINLYFAKNLIAIDCRLIKTYMRYFYISRKEVLENSDKWNSFVKLHLSEEIKNNVEIFVKRLNNILVFI